MSFVRIRIEVHHVSCFFRGLRARGSWRLLHPPEQVPERRWCRRRSWPPVCPWLVRADERHLVFGLGFGKEIVDSAWRAIAAAVNGLSPVIIMVANAHGAKMVETLLHAPLTMSVSAIAPTRGHSLHQQRRSARIRNITNRNLRSSAGSCDRVFAQRVKASSAPCGLRGVKVDARLLVWAEKGTKVAACVERSRPRGCNVPSRARRWIGLPESHSPARKAARHRQDDALDAGRRKELRGGTISESDRSRLVQQQHIHVARGFDCTPRHGDDVSLNQADPCRQCR